VTDSLAKRFAHETAGRAQVNISWTLLRFTNDNTLPRDCNGLARCIVSNFSWAGANAPGQIVNLDFLLLSAVKLLRNAFFNPQDGNVMIS
jgi:hypothetical protein